MTNIVWTTNFVVFFLLFLIWKRNDFLNLSLKVCFAVLAFVNAAPAFLFLQKFFQ